MATTLILLCAGATRMARTGGFPAADEPLDERGFRDGARCILPERFRTGALTSPMQSAQQTAEVMGLSATQEGRLADRDHGSWTGRSFTEIPQDALGLWLADPTQPASGGETMEAVRHRAGAWLDDIAGLGTNLCAISHPTVIRAILSHALGFSLTAALRIDIAPLSRIILSHNRFWRLQSLTPFS